MATISVFHRAEISQRTVVHLDAVASSHEIYYEMLQSWDIRETLFLHGGVVCLSVE